MKILSSQQVREADQFTIKHEPIQSIDLMERASKAFVTKFLGLHPAKQRLYIFCGTGNNGGDGLAIARLLIELGWEIDVFVVGDPEKGSDDFKINLEKLSSFKKIGHKDDFPSIVRDSIIIDGLFGSGLSRPVDGLHRELIDFLNNLDNVQRVAVDIASGLYSDQSPPKVATAFKADYTISFQLPKLSFFLPECASYVGQWRVVDIGLKKDFIEKQGTDFHLTEVEEVRTMIPTRSTFTHKSKVGRLLIVAGSKGKMGAAILCARGAFRAGAGLVNIHAPACGIEILQISIPEAMVSVDPGEGCVKEIPISEDTVAIGPGLGTNNASVEALKTFLKSYKKPLVIDADGINIISQHPDLVKSLPKESILTPHPGEFKRLVGDWTNDFEKLQKLRELCINNSLNIVLKGAFSAVCSSKGIVYFNPTGNPGLATAGSGDVLTGITAALLAQGLTPIHALRAGVFLHGAAGDEAVRELQTPWIQASDIIDFIPQAVNSLMSH